MKRKRMTTKRLHQEIGTLLATARKEASLRQIDAQKALGLKTPQYISNVERGICAVSPKVIAKLSRLYGLDKNKFAEKIAELHKQKVQDEIISAIRSKNKVA